MRGVAPIALVRKPAWPRPSPAYARVHAGNVKTHAAASILRALAMAAVATITDVLAGPGVQAAITALHGPPALLPLP